MGEREKGPKKCKKENSQQQKMKPIRKFKDLK